MKRRKLVEGQLSGADRDGEPVVARRQRAAPRVVVRAVRVVGAVEVELEAAVVHRLGLDVAAGAVGLFPARRVAEGDEEPIALRERDEADALAADVEAHGPRAGKVVGRSVAHLDLLDRAGVYRIDRNCEAERLVLREVTQTAEMVALLHGERRIVRVSEVVVLLVPQLRDVHRQPQRARQRANSAT